ncbi:MAG: peroxiredoxin-like family protein [Aureispira sp.]
MRYLALLFLLVVQYSFAQHGLGLEPLEIGSQAPMFEAKDQSGTLVKSSDLLKEGPLVLVFYRGTWCPYCQRHVSELQKGLEQLTAKGAKVVVVTPEQQEYIGKMTDKAEAAFPILHDESYTIMEAYHTKYTIQKSDKMFFKGYVVAHTKKHNQAEEAVLPVPATYIIRQNGTIQFVHFETNYKERSTLEMILEHLE